MNRKPLDATTMALAQTVVSASRRSGTDPVEELHRLGLIASPALRREIRIGVLGALLDRLYNIRPAEMMRRSANSAQTASSMYDTVIQFIEEYQKSLEET